MEIKKHLIKLNLLIVTSVVLILAACTKQSVNTSVNLPVVEGYLVEGNALTVKLYQQKNLTDTAKYGTAIRGLSVYVSDGTNKVLLTESPAGTYTYADKSFLVTGKTYTLSFQYLTYSVSAKTVMPTKPTNFASPHGNIYIAQSTVNSTLDTSDVLSWDNPDSLNHVLAFKNADGASFSLNSMGGSRLPNFELNTNQGSSYAVTQRTFAYYGHYTVLLFRVNQEYVDLIKSNTSNSTSQNLSNTPTNIVNGYGIFTAMQADTLSLNVFN